MALAHGVEEELDFEAVGIAGFGTELFAGAGDGVSIRYRSVV